MKILEEEINKSDLKNSENILNGEMVKAVVDVENPEIREKIKAVVKKWIK
ncbi:hypothetical protein IJH66_01210 [Candidatus Saccharibacteria bacterium]|nr:hypothetical protein [Candidatus Saccharibacteria bacterium]